MLLLSCYELGHQPLGVARPAALLERAGFRPAQLDLSLGDLDPDAVAAARFIGLSVPMHTALALGIEAAGGIRTLNPGAHLCFYGLYASLNERLLLGGPADSVIGGEFGEPLLRLVAALAAGEAAPAVAGVALPGRSSPPAITRPSPEPIPARAGLPPLDRYARLAVGGETRLVGTVEATRGCKHTCLHCPITPVYRGRFFAVPRETVLADIDALVAMGAGHITFGDPDFLNGPRHAIELARALHARHPGVTFDFTAKIAHLLRHRALLPELVRSGALFVVSAVESLSDAVLAALAKGHTRADVEAALALCRAAGLTLRPSLLPFTPWAALGDYIDLLRWIYGEGLLHHVDPVQLSIRLLVPPGSALLGTPQFAPCQGALDARALTYRWHHPDPRMDALHARIEALVEAAAQRTEPVEETFRAILATAADVAGLPDLPAAILAQARPSAPAPRLTEPWFC